MEFMKSFAELVEESIESMRMAKEFAFGPSDPEPQMIEKEEEWKVKKGEVVKFYNSGMEYEDEVANVVEDQVTFVNRSHTVHVKQCYPLKEVVIFATPPKKLGVGKRIALVPFGDMMKLREDRGTSKYAVVTPETAEIRNYSNVVYAVVE